MKYIYILWNSKTKSLTLKEANLFYKVQWNRTVKEILGLILVGK